MFKEVRTKLTLSYTLSLVLLLIMFIALLYFFISHEINEKQINEILAYFNKEQAEFIEEMYEQEHDELEFDPNRSIFYYVYNQHGQLVYGEETVRYFSSWLGSHDRPNEDTFSERITWKQHHLVIVKKLLPESGFVILGKDISSEEHLVQTITWTLIGLTLLFSGLYASLGYYLAGQAIKPIKNAFQKQEKFVSDASHELRTPVSIFYSSIDLLMREEKENLSLYGQEVLEDVKAEAALMGRLINGLLELARSDQNQLNLDRQDINLSDLMTGIYKRFSRKISTDVQFNKDISSGIYLNCDEVRIQQLLYILLDNAFCYTKSGGEVTIRLKLRDNKRIITVEDTGSGISPDDQPYVFDRFYRADMSREKGGTGLGLAIAKTIVAAHQGSISVRSTIGEGTTFTVIFEE